jgi:hypothetical protein
MKGRPRYSVIKCRRDGSHPRLHWQPPKEARARGHKNVACGPDGRRARAMAERCSRAWQRERETLRNGGFDYLLDLRALSQLYSENLERLGIGSRTAKAPAFRKPSNSGPRPTPILAGADVDW